MKTSIATVSISGSLSEKLTAIAVAGFDAIEIFENDFLAFDGPPSDVAEMVRDHGLEISLFQPFRNFEGMPGKRRAQAFERAERKFDLMQELGTDLILICSNVSPLALGGIDRAADDFEELGERAPRKIFASAMKLWRGGSTLMITGMLGKLCDVPIMPISD